MLGSFGQDLRVVVVGANGALGGAFVRHISRQESLSRIYALSRQKPDFKDSRITSLQMDFLDEQTIEQSAAKIGAEGPLDLILVATGILHEGEGLQPEKSLKDLKISAFERVFAINTIGPSMVAKHFLPLLRRDQKSCCAFLSARVGSISDNALGGWYAYRASKAALNMVMRSAAIETARRHPKSVVVCLHPGTVDSALSAPFQKNKDPAKLFTPDDSALKMLHVLDGLQAPQSGKFFAYDGQEIAF